MLEPLKAQSGQEPEQNLPDAMAAQIQWGHQLTQTLQGEINKVFIGQQQVLNQVLIGLLSAGHVLIEGLPGLGKTLLVRALAKCIGGDFSRIQFTPDLMPSDITGHAIYDMNAKQFQMRKGPVFTNLLLADEINRAPAKTQAALLEVMQEKQVTIEGQSYASGNPFMVLATQNPIEQEGTYPLPEAELDRFMMKIIIGYPALYEEITLVKLVTQGRAQTFNIDSLQTIMSLDEVIKLQDLTSQLIIDDAVLDYVIRLVRATRDFSGIAKGASPRASIAIVRAAKANALINGNCFVTPDDVKAVAPMILRHRIMLSADMEIEGVKSDQLLSNILDHVEAPRQ
ncbi:MAG: MoxR-like ATPase [Alteromonadaceae bacterium]|jgi:MoxR-like ATPase